ncbi:sugar ABC transporter ATP-binding protein [Fretibacterium sp. OH1220_COT-178]|uniref:sugar ABC transporter ATP-binding protein n=1 Tax=Fretibacterium sp. OH1220_COT-178 TaxID=2491047 RepID=UPI000F5F46FF|nr:sugar ABC transporter ATP-binding protein [Fretibacterium sp. OH1220_COT-178]RRD63382.1 sugar ABC transporter ATP-binding protein [Fretibacterium sp. OH1220_COT-178]
MDCRGNELLRVDGICKDFSTVRVLHDVSFRLCSGEILGIIGENGAGKSTIMKILSGIHSPTSGEIYLDGKKADVLSPMDAKKLGISLIPQEFNLVNDLTVYDNVFLGSELLKKNGLLDKARMKERTAELLRDLGVSIPPEARIEDLSAAEKQMVEICKALAFRCRILIMDEPTTVLTQHETGILFNRMRRLRDEGMTIIYISHKLKEIKSICDRVLVLRDGSFVLDRPTEEISLEEMAQSMVGRELSQIFPPKLQPRTAPLLEVRNLSVPGVLHDVSFTLREGEILGFGGLVGAGRTEVAEALMGLRPLSAGEILLRGKSLRVRTPRDAVEAGFAYLSEDRQGSGIITSFSVVHNTTLTSLPRYSSSRLRWLDKRAETEAAGRYRDLFNLKAPSLGTPLEHLSGGNQQKVSLSKTIDTRPSVLIADEPTRGVDIAAKQEVYRFITDIVRGRIACILISSEMEELIGMCHRVAVMQDGRITGVLDGDRICEEEIMFHATGIREGA